MLFNIESIMGGMKMNKNGNDTSRNIEQQYSTRKAIDTFEKRGGIGENPPPSSPRPGFKKTGK